MAARLLLNSTSVRVNAKGPSITGNFRRWKATGPRLPLFDFQPQPYEGISFEKAYQIRKDHISPSILSYYGAKPLMITQGYMQYAFDHTGRRYVDMFGGICTLHVGQCNKQVTKALQEQADILWHTTNVYFHPKLHEYAEKLASKFPGNLKVIYLTNSGSEANDLAMMMARIATGNWDVINLRNAYHGASPYSQGLTALGNWKYPNFANGFGIHSTVNPDPFRGIWGGANCRDSPVQTCRKCDCKPNSCEASDMYVLQLQDLINHCVPKGKVAAFFAEPIQGYGGIVQYPKGYVKRAFEIIRSNGGLCIADEVQTGFGRTGDTYWGFEMHDVLPDIVTLAKGIGNGFPLGAVVTTPDIAKSLTNALTFNTFGGGALACAAGIAVLDYVDKHNLQLHAKEIGTYFLKQLAPLRDEFQFCGDVRGKGLMIGVELVTDKETKTPLPVSEITKIFDNIREMGLLVGRGGLHGSVLRIQPPLIIEKDDADFAVEVLRCAFKNYQNKEL